MNAHQSLQQLAAQINVEELTQEQVDAIMNAKPECLGKRDKGAERTTMADRINKMVWADNVSSNKYEVL